MFSRQLGFALHLSTFIGDVMSNNTVSNSVRWTATSNAFRAAVSFLQIVILARLIPPSEFGLFAIVSSIQMFASNFSDAGISSAIIHFQNINEIQKSSLFWWNIFISTAIFVAVVALGYPLSIFYNNSGLIPLIAISASILVINALSQQIKALAERDMRFASLAKIEMTASVIGVVLAIFMAFIGWGVMSIVVSQVAMAAMSSLMCWALLSNGWRPSRHFSVRHALPYIRYGANVLLVNLLNIFISQIDIMVLGRLVGPYTLGIYSQPRDLGLKIMTVINPVITRVGFPMMAKNKNDKQALARIYLKTMRMSASVSFPIFAGISVLSRDIVILVYGERWAGAAPYLQTLAVWFLVRSVGNPLGGLLYAVGATRMAFIQSTCLLVVMPIGVYVAATYDAKLVPIALIAIHGTLIPIVWHFMIRPICGASVIDCAKQILPPATCVALTVAVAAAIQHLLPITGVVRIGIIGAAGIACYFVFSLLINREWTNEMKRLLS